MRIQWVIVLAVALLTSCTTAPAPPEMLRTPFVKEGEPIRPLIQGEISGVGEDTLVTIYRRTPGGRRVGYSTRRGNGSWKATLTLDSGADYVVTAEAPAYVPQPISYTIYLSEEAAYLVLDGELHGRAVGLDFHFVPERSP